MKVKQEMKEQKNDAPKPNNGYVVPKGEEKLFHCKIEVVRFNPNTGERLSRPRIQKFGQKIFELVLPKLREQGYTIEILHNPKK